MEKALKKSSCTFYAKEKSLWVLAFSPGVNRNTTAVGVEGIFFQESMYPPQCYYFLLEWAEHAGGVMQPLI
jgi:hypothetical protein